MKKSDEAFPDGVIWITFGQTPQILTLQSDVVEALGDKQASFTEINSGKTQLRKLLTDKACLLILDDVWNLEHASAFDVLEKRSQMLITTRDAGIITALGGEEYQLSILSETTGFSFIGRLGKSSRRDVISDSIRGSARMWVFAISIVNGGSDDAGKPTNRWQNVLEKLR